MFITRKKLENVKKDLYELLNLTIERHNNLEYEFKLLKREIKEILEKQTEENLQLAKQIENIPLIKKYQKTLDLMLNSKKKGN